MTRFCSACLAPLLFAACAAPVGTTPQARTEARPIPPSPVAAAPDRAAQPAPVAPRLVQTRVGGIGIELVAFDSRTHRLRVADQADGPGSRWPDSRAAAAALGGVAACNGGFFTPQGQPLGLVISHGRRDGTLNRSSLGSGLWLDPGDARPVLLRREAWSDASGPRPVELLQSGPFLVENRRAVGGLESERLRPRSVLAWDGGDRWFIGITSPCTLAGLAQALAVSQPAGWRVRHALNLDGGRSSELWVSGAVDGGPLFRRPIWNTAVRNYLVVSEK